VLLVRGGSALQRHGERLVDVRSYDPDKVTDRLIVLSPLGMLAGSALVAPRLQLYTYLMCRELDDPTYGRIQSVGSTRTIPCAADPVVQANVAKFLTSQCVIHDYKSYLLRKPN
jgi:hypothetical protein